MLVSELGGAWVSFHLVLVVNGSWLGQPQVLDGARRGEWFWTLDIVGRVPLKG